jgi:hypothetical protein
MSRDIKYIGMDVHKEAVVIAVLNSSGQRHGGSDAPKQRLQNRLIPSSQARSALTVAPSSESFPATRNPDSH